MATKFAAPVIALALLVIASSVDKPLEEKFVLSAEKPVSDYVCRRRIVALNFNGSSSGACALFLHL